MFQRRPRKVNKILYHVYPRIPTTRLYVPVVLDKQAFRAGIQGEASEGTSNRRDAALATVTMDTNTVLMTVTTNTDLEYTIVTMGIDREYQAVTINTKNTKTRRMERPRSQIFITLRQVSTQGQKVRVHFGLNTKVISNKRISIHTYIVYYYILFYAIFMSVTLDIMQ